MIRQATVRDVSRGAITKLHGRVVVITCYYPRFLKRRLVHDYFPVLAPSRDLLKEFKTAEETLGDHDGALESIDYETKYGVGAEGLRLLRNLCAESTEQTIFLICHCRVGQRCHRELVMLLARELFDAKISKLSFDWAIFRARIQAGEFEQPD